jgi:hypothetical protein
MSSGMVQLSDTLPLPGPWLAAFVVRFMREVWHGGKHCQNYFLAFPVGTNKFQFMPNVSLTITLPEHVAQQVHETAQSQYLSRSAVLRQIIMKELERLRGAENQASAEVPA